jgi:hypothetical protein
MFDTRVEAEGHRFRIRLIGARFEIPKIKWTGRWIEVLPGGVLPLKNGSLANTPTRGAAGSYFLELKRAEDFEVPPPGRKLPVANRSRYLWRGLLLENLTLGTT